MLKITRILIVSMAVSGAVSAQTAPETPPPAAPPVEAAPAPAPAAPAAQAPAPAPAPPPPVTPAPAPQRLTGAAAIAAIAGNTLSGKIDGADNTIFFSNDGRMTMLVDAEQTQGKWELRGREVCILVEDEDDECYDLEVTGDVAVLKEDASTSYRLTITRGNAKNLPLARR